MQLATERSPPLGLSIALCELVVYGWLKGQRPRRERARQLPSPGDAAGGSPTLRALKAPVNSPGSSPTWAACSRRPMGVLVPSAGAEGGRRRWAYCACSGLARGPAPPPALRAGRRACALRGRRRRRLRGVREAGATPRAGVGHRALRRLGRDAERGGGRERPSVLGAQPGRCPAACGLFRSPAPARPEVFSVTRLGRAFAELGTRPVCWLFIVGLGKDVYESSFAKS